MRTLHLALLALLPFMTGCLAIVAGAAAGEAAGRSAARSAYEAAEFTDDSGARAVGITVGEDLVITDVRPGSSAEKKGVLPGDRIIEVEALEVSRKNEVYYYLYGPEGKTAHIKVRRPGRKHYLTFNLEREDGP